MQRQPRGSNNIPSFFNKPHLLHVLFVKVVPGTIFTSWSKHHFVVIGQAEQQVRKPSHCGPKQQWRSHDVLILFLLVRATSVLFITHIPFVVNRTFNTTLTRAVASGARLLIWNRCPPISRLAPRLLHTSNTVFQKFGPTFCFLATPAAKSWRQAWC